MPITRALGVKWQLSVENLMQGTVVEMWVRSFDMFRFRDIFNQNITAVVGPISLKKLYIWQHLSFEDDPSFGGVFDQPITRFVCGPHLFAKAANPGRVRPAHRRSCVATLPATAIGRSWVQPLHRWRRADCFVGRVIAPGRVRRACH